MRHLPASLLLSCLCAWPSILHPALPKVVWSRGDCAKKHELKDRDVVKSKCRLVTFSAVCPLCVVESAYLFLLHCHQDLAEDARYRTHADSFDDYIHKSRQSVLRFMLHDAVLRDPKSLEGRIGICIDLNRLCRQATFLTRQDKSSGPPGSSAIPPAGYIQPSSTISASSTSPPMSPFLSHSTSQAHRTR